MSREILCEIEQEELEEYELLHQNQSTIYTLMQIKQEKCTLDENILLDLNSRLKIINQKISCWWETISHKYHIPYYINKNMFINSETREIYVE